MFGIRYSDISTLSEMQIKSRYLNNGYNVDSWKTDKAEMIKSCHADLAWPPESKKPNLKGWAFCWVFLVPTAGFELAT